MPSRFDFEKEPVLAARGVKGLYEVGGVPEEHGVAGGSAHHAQHRQPHVRQRLRGEPGAVEIKTCILLGSRVESSETDVSPWCHKFTGWIG